LSTGTTTVPKTLVKIPAVTIASWNQKLESGDAKSKYSALVELYEALSKAPRSKLTWNDMNLIPILAAYKSRNNKLK
jgi:hypothetical protein